MDEFSFESFSNFKNETKEDITKINTHIAMQFSFTLKQKEVEMKN